MGDGIHPSAHTLDSSTIPEAEVSLRVMVIGVGTWHYDYGFLEAIHNLFHLAPVETSMAHPVYPDRKTTSLAISSTSTFYLLGQSRNVFFQMDEILEKGFLGMLVIANSAQPNDFRELQSILQTLWSYAIFPYRVVVINLEAEDAWPLDDLKIALRLSSDTPVSACNLTDRESLKGVLLAFLDQVLAFGEEATEEATIYAS